MTGQSNEPAMPDRGVSTPMRMSAEGDICNVVLPNNTAVEVIVVNPVQMDASIFDHVKVLKNADHQKGGTRPQET